MRRSAAVAAAVAVLFFASSGDFFASPALTERVSSSIVQIGLASRVRKALVKPEGAFRAVDQADGSTHELDSGKTLEVRLDSQGRIRLGFLTARGSVRLLPGGPQSRVAVGSRRYRGSLLIKAGEGGTVTVVNELGLEEYLYGVLAREMSADWPVEALKAQAVVARTWALNNLGKYEELGYDLSDDDRSQVYRGLDAESARVLAAVRATAGEVLVWRGGLLDVFFHACCGGHTAPAAAIWGGASAPKPLRGVLDRWCAGCAYSRWSAYFSNEDLLDVLQNRGFAAAHLDWIRPGQRDPSGYLEDVRIRADKQTLTVRANDLRTWLGPAELRSTQITRIVRRRKGYEFLGRGFGHGVGLCQWGARSQAQKGRGYRKILAHYFPGADISVRDE